MMVVSAAMLAFDTLYLIYLYSLTRAFPPFVTSWLMESILGDVSKVERVLHQALGYEKTQQLEMQIAQLEARQEEEKQKLQEE